MLLSGTRSSALISQDVDLALRYWLAPTEQRLVRLRFGIGDELLSDIAWVGRVLGISAGRAERLEIRALRKLRDMATSTLGAADDTGLDFWDEA